MINAQELRLGNWVNVLHGNVQIEKFVTDGVHFTDGNGGTFASLSPIELTHELLEKCGFVVSEDLGDMVYYQFPNQNHGYGICRNHDEWEFYRYHGIGMEVLIYDEKHFQYLHQLQNLYWCLCGEELDINLHELQNK